MWSLVASTLALLDAPLSNEVRQSSFASVDPLPTMPSYAYLELAIFVGRRVGRAVDARGDQLFDRIHKDGFGSSFPDEVAPVYWIATALRDRTAIIRTVILKRIQDELPLALARSLHAIASARGVEVSRALLSAIDDEHARLDAIHAIDARGLITKSAIASAVYRGPEIKSSDGVAPPLWLTRLANRHHGLLWFADGVWTFTEGERDEVLAHVPDAHFEAAATQAMRGA